MEEGLQIFSPRTAKLMPGTQMHSMHATMQLGQQCNAHGKDLIAPKCKGSELSIERMDDTCEIAPREHKLGADQRLGDAKCFNDLEQVINHKVDDAYPSPHDFACALCLELLYRPIILNGGEACCEPCVKKRNDQIVQIKRNPKAPAFVCLELHHYLQTRFPVQYRQREHTLSPYVIENRIEETEAVPHDDPTMEDIYTFIHEGVGCDGCGMYPIVGRRYRCKDCVEKVGYDLCEHCQKSGCHEGRFNQHHQIHHELEEVLAKPKQVRSLARPGYSFSPFMLNLLPNVVHQSQQAQAPQTLLTDFDDYISHLL